jgi:hypothetical protein
VGDISNTLMSAPVLARAGFGGVVFHGGWVQRSRSEALVREAAAG